VKGKGGCPGQASTLSRRSALGGAALGTVAAMAAFSSAGGLVSATAATRPRPVGSRWSGSISRSDIESKLTARLVGSGTPILFLHSWTSEGADEADAFEPIFGRIEGWQRIYPDLPGMGDSEATRIANLDAMVEAIGVVIAECIGSREFAVAGSSAGGYLAQGIASKYGDQVLGVLLRSPVVVPTFAKRDIGPLLGIHSANCIDRSKPVDRATIIADAAYERARASKEQLRDRPARDRAQMEMIEALREDESRYVLNVPFVTSPQPTLIIAPRQDARVGYRDAWNLMERFPRATFVAVDRAEHAFPLDPLSVRLFEGLVENWLQRVEEYRRGRSGDTRGAVSCSS
jgi:pimeloyl-ACP methyl ester carboxylesterase